MCQRVTCSTCGKPTYAGCGRHIEAVLGDVPVEARCHCRERTAHGEKTAKGSDAGLFDAIARHFRRSP